jgi:hypothetical protein
MNGGTFIIFIIFIIIITFIFVKFWNSHKNIKCNSILFISGSPKTGKSLLSIYKAFNNYNSKIRKYYMYKAIEKTLFNLYSFNYDMPYFYSNIPLCWNNKEYLLNLVMLTKEHLKREVRITNNAVVYLGEFSLVANSKLGMRYGIDKNSKIDYDLLNENLLLFTKLIGHESKNIFMVCDSQTISDNHYSLKRCLSQYVYIHHNINIPFFKILFIKEYCYSEDNSNMQIGCEDIENGLRWLIIPKKYYKCYDYRCYSVLTDNLPIKNNVVHFNNNNLKCNDIVSFCEFKSLKNKENENYE